MPVQLTEASLLQSVKVLVTRPTHQADSLCQLLISNGAAAVRFPLLEILDPDNSDELVRCVAHLDEYDWAIFVSINAVQRAVPAILEKRGWPEKIRIAVIGKSSAAALQTFGLSADACPESQFDSEGLLNLPVMQQVTGSRVVIFRGDGGRELLAKRLRARGAIVEYVECYRRVKPVINSLNSDELGKISNVDVALINSADSLKNLLELFSGRSLADLLKVQLLVVSKRLVESVQQAGFVKPPLIADNATDNAVLEALLDWQRQHRPQADT
jgi:uroporphyrinogen-III synthase